MLQQDEPADYVVATGESHSVREFLMEAFDAVKLPWYKYVEIDPRYYRPTEVDHLLGDATKARKELGWRPKVTFQELVKMMVAHDLDMAKGELTLKNGGHTVPLQREAVPIYG
jgi:GDPmannose 4,6-dehydratase